MFFQRLRRLAEHPAADGESCNLERILSSTCHETRKEFVQKFRQPHGRRFCHPSIGIQEYHHSFPSSELYMAIALAAQLAFSIFLALIFGFVLFIAFDDIPNIIPTEMNPIARQPSIFLSHGGGPCFFMEGGMFKAIDKHSEAAAFLRGFAKNHLPARPNGIVVISAHWITAEKIHISANPSPKLLFDYYGFPPHTYDLTWPAPSDLLLSNRVNTLLSENNIPTKLDASRDWDHGVFIPLKLAFPEADIPLVQISIRNDFDPSFHYKIGELLAPLRDEGYLIVGSGQSSHNFAEIFKPTASPDPPEYLQKFSAWLDRVSASSPEERKNLLLKWENEAPESRRVHPPGGEDHLVPFFITAGAAGNAKGKKISETYSGNMLLSSYSFLEEN